MFAQVYPLLRLPRRFTFFDYQIPEILDVTIGDLVMIPFKGRRLYGVVKKLVATSEYKKISALEAVIIPALLTSADIERLETIAWNLAQSPASLFYAVLQGIEAKKMFAKEQVNQTRALSVDPQTAGEVTRALKHLAISCDLFAQTSLEGTLAICKNLSLQAKQQVLIITPTERDAELTHRLLAATNSSVLHGGNKPAERRFVIENWRSGNIKILVGTRQASLLPARKIELVIVTQSSSDDYRITDRNPRLEVRNCIQLLTEQHRAKLLSIDHYPRPEDRTASRELELESDPDLISVDLSAKEEFSGQPMLSESLLNAIRETLQSGQKVLCSYNRKGVAKRLQCTHCGHLPKCGTCGNLPVIRLDDLICRVCGTEMWPPKNCPACGSIKLKNQGLGNEKIADSLRKLFPDKIVKIIDLAEVREKVRPDQIATADITLVTEYYFAGVHKPFTSKQYGLVAELCFDHHLAGDFRAREQAARKLYRLWHLARQQHARCLIQTWSVGEVQLMREVNKFLDEELKVRKRYRLPPCFDHINNQVSELVKRAIILDELIKRPDSEIIQTDFDHYAAPSSHLTQ